MNAEKGLPGLLRPEHELMRVTDDLAQRFDGVFSHETVERYVFESYTSLARSAKVSARLVVLSEKWTRDRLVALAQSMGAIAKEVPEVLFVCVQNAGRSQMAAGLLNLRAQGAVHVRSAGSSPAEAIHFAVASAMEEVGIDLGHEFPKPLTDDVVRAADVVITMGCGDACPIYPGTRYEDWQLADPANATLEEARRIRDDIDRRVQQLLLELVPSPGVERTPGAGSSASASVAPASSVTFALLDFSSDPRTSIPLMFAGKPKYRAGRKSRS